MRSWGDYKQKVLHQNIRAGYRRHPNTLPYRCYLSILAGFERFRRAGPARTGARILEVKGGVNFNAVLLRRREKRQQAWGQIIDLIFRAGT